MDATVGMFMTLIDTDPRRRELYGKAGAFRPKSYGVEYRTPSNLWLTHVSRRKLIYHLVNTAIKMNSSGVQFQAYINGSLWRPVKRLSMKSVEEAQLLVQQTIDNGDKDMAKTILMNVLSQTGWDGDTVTSMLKAELKRMEKSVRHHDHIVQVEVTKGMKIA
jgi:GTPase involved in cell partitioning and DNA repair